MEPYFIAAGRTLATATEIASGQRFHASSEITPTDWEFNCHGCDLPAWLPASMQLGTPTPHAQVAPTARGFLGTKLEKTGAKAQRLRPIRRSRGAYLQSPRPDYRSLKFTGLVVAADTVGLDRWLSWMTAELADKLSSPDAKVWILDCDGGAYVIPSALLEDGPTVKKKLDDGIAEVNFTISSPSPTYLRMPYSPLSVVEASTLAAADQFYACCDINSEPTGCSPILPPLPAGQPGCFCMPWRVLRHYATTPASSVTGANVIDVTVSGGVTPYAYRVGEDDGNNTGQNLLPRSTDNVRISIFDPSLIPAGTAEDFAGLDEAATNLWFCNALVGQALLGSIPAGASMHMEGATGRFWLTLVNGDLHDMTSQVQSRGQKNLLAALSPTGPRIVLVELDEHHTAPDTQVRIEAVPSTVALGGYG